MTALWIVLGVLAAIILIIAVLLHISIRIFVSADNKHVHGEVKYLGFRLYKLDAPDNDKSSETSDTATEDKSDAEPVFTLSELEEAPEEAPSDSGKEEAKAEEVKGEENVDSSESADNTSETEKSSKKEKAVKKSHKEKEPGLSLAEQYNEYKKYIPAGKKAFKKLLRLIRFYGLKFSLTVGNDDPYKAGLNFGRINAAVYSLLGLLCCIFSVKIDSTEISCDFENNRTDFSFETYVYLRPSAIIALALYIGIYYLKVRKSMKKLDNMAKEKINNE